LLKALSLDFTTLAERIRHSTAKQWKAYRGVSPHMPANIGLDLRVTIILNINLYTKTEKSNSLAQMEATPKSLYENHSPKSDQIIFRSQRQILKGLCTLKDMWRHMITSPLISKTRVIGMIFIASTRSPHTEHPA